jgi:5'-nucleotidase
MKNKPLILISNDDGFIAPGIRFLIEVLKPFAELLVVAPQSGRSGMSTAITVKTPLDLIQVSEEPDLRIFRSNGTPVDCVKLALNILTLDRQPDLIVSGINHGSNASVAIHYSGTMGAVLEGCMSGIPSIGFSLDNHMAEANFKPCRPFIESIVKSVLEHSLPKGVCLNVNFPDVETIKGLKICRQTRGRWVEEFDVRKHPRGGDYYWLMGAFRNDEPQSADTDMYCMEQGYAAVVPSQIDMTSYEMIETMKTWNL